MHKRQSDLIAYLTAQLSEEKGVKALYLKGSIANGSDDDFSDVDFYCLTDEAYYETMLSKRESLLSAYRPVLYKQHVNFGIPQLIVIYDHDLHLDFYVTKAVPMEGHERIKVIFDPQDILADYKVVRRIDNLEEVKSYLNDAIFTLHELNIAYQRKDFLWAIRLETHILAYLSLVLSHTYEQDRSLLHMKGLFHHIPKTLQHDFSEILTHMSSNQVKECMKLLTTLIDKIITNESEEIIANLNLGYLEYIKSEICLE